MASDVATQQVTPRTAGFAAPARTGPHARTLVSWPTAATSGAPIACARSPSTRR